MLHAESDRLIAYRFTFADGQTLEHDVDLQGPAAPVEAAAWARLDFQQCPHCPLSVQDSALCPFAAALQQPVSIIRIGGIFTGNGAAPAK